MGGVGPRQPQHAVNPNGRRWLVPGRACLGYSFILINRVAADPNAAHQHAVLIERQPARKLDEAPLLDGVVAGPGIITVADVPQRATRLGQKSQAAAADGILVA